MTDDLESLIQQAEQDIGHRTAARSGSNRSKLYLPRVSVAACIWLAALLIGFFQFENVVSLVASPTESKIERDLENILSKTAGSLRAYASSNGVLPPILPNPAIRGLVKYERRSDYSFQLTATIGNVTMVMDSNRAHAYRTGDEG